MTTPMSSIAWVNVASFIGSLGAVGLKAGAKNLKLSIPALATNWKLHAGIAGYLISWVFFVLGLKQGDLSVLYPMVSLGYIWTLLWSRWFFGEPLTGAKFTALGLILVGVALLGVGTR
jgi:multidrug transporter EmrE-like cation transporter